MRIITLTLALAALVLGGCASVPVDRHTRPDIFAEVCTAMERDCSDLLPPIIVISEAAASKGYLGFTYNGEEYVFINPHVEEWTYGEVTIDDVIFHETVHYVHHSDPDTYPGVCESERIARVLSADRVGVPYDDSWEELYGCFQTD